MKLSIIIFSVFTWNFFTVLGQELEPLVLAERIFNKEDMPNMDAYLTEDYNGPLGLDFKKGVTQRFILLEQKKTSAVVRMTLLDSLAEGIDTYLYFQKDSIWKVKAFRALANTGSIQELRNSLEHISKKEVRRIIKYHKRRGDPDSYAMFSSMEDYNFQLGNARLILELDQNIAKHFLANQDEFERLKRMALEQVQKEKSASQGKINLIENLKPSYEKLFISAVSTGGPNFKNCINFLIGGIVDNAVGYLYVEDTKDLPVMNPENVIMLKKITGAWYMYKTT
ncbi:hypothetical protein [Leeuwenhoekiella marinoflava]|uniref:hypothetical protein n=1 Tax=Leeuwenhoekiella marinoflava TaxID=988 RepID=UPI003003699D